jgi:hypothetical protein
VRLLFFVVALLMVLMIIGCQKDEFDSCAEDNFNGGEYAGGIANCY